MLSIDNDGNLVERDTAFYTSEVMNYLLKIIEPNDLEKLITLLISADMNTNSLMPLNEDSSIEEWCKSFVVKSVSYAERLLDLAKNFGIIRMFPEEEKYSNYPHTAGYVLNPYFLSWKKQIRSDVNKLFEDTDLAIIAKATREKYN